MATNPEGLRRWLEIHNNSQQKGAPAQPQRTTITFEKLATIRVPTLLMPGDQDLQCPPWVMRRQLARIPWHRVHRRSRDLSLDQLGAARRL
jgi:hypothetical protein